VGRRGAYRGVRRAGAGHRGLTTAVARTLRLLADGALTVLLAPVCAACQASLEAPTLGAVCPRCWAAIIPITPPCCRTCGDALPSWRIHSVAESRCPRCRRKPPLIAHACAIGPYEGSLRAIVQALKYGGRQTIARPLSARLRSCGAGVLAGADAVVPVPLHASRERSRGFNQARELARHLEMPMLDALLRSRRTAVQADLPAARRHANVEGAFVHNLNTGAVKGLTLVLVDDVSTTGATLSACAAPLIAAGAREVRALIAARAVTRQL
jgi:ComF family protein